MKTVLLSLCSVAIACVLAFGVSRAGEAYGAADAGLVDAGVIPPGSVVPVDAATNPALRPDARIVEDSLRDVVAGDHRGRAIAIVLLIGAVYCFRRWGRAPLPWVGWKILPAWFGSDRGGVVLTLSLAFIGGIGHALAAGAPVNLSLFEAAFMTALAASGGYVGIRRLLWPPDKSDESPPVGDFTRST
jgi:hypothetical protein